MEDVHFVEKLQPIIRSAGWNEIVKPAISAMKARAMANWSKAGSPENREQIIGEIRVLDWLLGWDQRLEYVAKRLEETLQEEAETPKPDPLSLNGGTI